MPAPLLPRRDKACWWAIDRFGAVELAWGRDADDGSPPREFLVGHVPRRVRFFGVASVKPCALLVGWELEVAHLHRCTEVGCCLAEGRALVSIPEAEVDHNVDAEREGS